MPDPEVARRRRVDHLVILVHGVGPHNREKMARYVAMARANTAELRGAHFGGGAAARCEVQLHHTTASSSSSSAAAAAASAIITAATTSSC